VCHLAEGGWPALRFYTLLCGRSLLHVTASCATKTSCVLLSPSGNAVADEDRVDRVVGARLPVVVADEVVVRGVERHGGHLLIREAERMVR
jgi:hypothetical protein